MAGYAAAKAGVINLTRTLAAEWGQYNISVNCLTPGLINTPLTQRTIGQWPERLERTILERIPLGRMGEAVEVAKAALFLVSDGASYISGVTLPVDGGQLTGV